MDVLWFKLIAALALLCLIPLCGGLPFLIANRVSAHTRQMFLSLANAFAGGIFLGGGFVHLLADANKEFDILLKDALHVQLGMVLAPIGLLFAFFVEKVLLKGHDHAHGVAELQPNGAGHGHQEGHDTRSDEKGILLTELPVQVEEPANGTNVGPSVVPEVHVGDLEGDTDLSMKLTGSGGVKHRHHVARHDDSLEEAASTAVSAKTTDGSSRVLLAPADAHGNDLLPYLLAFVLSIHSVIGGMALGIQSSPAKVTPLFIAILSHKWIEAFALGASILKNSANFKSFVKIIAFYSLTSPAGILLGVLLDTALQGVWAGGVITAVLVALAAGSFIYVAIVDILVEEFSNTKWKWAKLLLCICGLAFNTFISILFEED